MNNDTQISIDDILVSYGTRYPGFYKVIGKTEKGIKIIPMFKTTIKYDDKYRTSKIMPVKPVLGSKPINRKIYIDDYNDKPYIAVDSFSNAHKWNGEPATEDHNGAW